MAKFLWKPSGENSNELVILTDNTGIVSIVDLDSGNIIEQGRDSGQTGGFNNVSRFSKPGSAFNNVGVIDSQGNLIATISNGSQRLVGEVGGELRHDPTGDGDLSGGGASGVAPPIAANPNFLTPNFVSGNQIEGVDPLDIFGIAGRATEESRQGIVDAFGAARDISDENFVQARDRIRDINTFNAAEQGRALTEGVPQANRILDQNLDTLEAFSRGRLPDALENEILNQTTREIAAAQSSIVGGGVTSSFGSRINNQLQIRERIGLQESALNAAPSFIANALQLRRGPTTRAQFDPNEVGNIARNIAQVSTLTPAQAISAETQQQQLQIGVQEVNAGIANRAEQFNAETLTNFQNSLLDIDLFNQREQQNFIQNVLKQETQTAADTSAEAQAQANAEANIASNEAAAASQATQEGIGTVGAAAAAVPAVIGAVEAVTDFISGEDEPVQTQPQPTQPTQPQGPVVAEASPLPPKDFRAPVDTQGNSVVSPPASVASTILPDGSVGTINSNGSVSQDFDTEISNFEPDVSTQDSDNFRSAKLDIPLARVRSNSTSVTAQDDRKITAHRTARANISKLLPPGSLSADQVRNRDGTVGLLPNKSITDIERIQSPVPASVYPTLSGGDATAQASNLNAAVKVFNTPGKIAKPLRESNFFTPNSRTIGQAFIPISQPDRKFSELGQTLAKTVFDEMEITPITGVTIKDANGDLIVDPSFYADLGLDALEKGKAFAPPVELQQTGPLKLSEKDSRLLNQRLRSGVV